MLLCVIINDNIFTFDVVFVVVDDLTQLCRAV